MQPNQNAVILQEMRFLSGTSHGRTTLRTIWLCLTAGGLTAGGLVAGLLIPNPRTSCAADPEPSELSILSVTSVPAKGHGSVSEDGPSVEFTTHLPKLAPLERNAANVDSRKAALGKRLFFDPRLSGDATLSCATCHRHEKGWTDHQRLSRGYPGALYFRNTPTLLGASHRRWFYWDGRLSGSDLPALIRDHVSEAHFLQADGRLVIERMRQVPEYAEAFREAFGGEPSYGRILNALAAFLRTLEPGPIPLDWYLTGEATSPADSVPADQSGGQPSLSDRAVRGLTLFRGKAGCIRCHHGPMLTDELFHSIGVMPNPDIFLEPMRHITFRRFFRTLGISRYAQLRHDIGREAITKQSADEGLFRTPSLREVGRTAPYMHNGSLATLRDVVDFYNRGGGSGIGKDPRIKPLGLIAEERSDLVHFLQSLSSAPIVVEPVVPPPYSADAPLASGPWREGGNRIRRPSVAQQGRTAAVGRKRAESDDPPDGYPPLAVLPPVPVPADNPITSAKVALGRLLFFDDRLSGDVGTSCASCHDPRLGWGDGNALSRGYAGTQHWRNSQTIINAAYLSKLFWAGEVTSMEMQASSAITGNVAGNGDPVMIEERLKQIPQYVAMFREAFGTPPRYELALKAIASFEREVPVSRDSPLDEYLAGDEEALTEGALRGFALFTGKANCIRCHHGPQMTDENFHVLGIPNHPLFGRDPLRQITHRFQHFARGVPEEVYRTSDRDLGLYYMTKRVRDQDKFRTPPLRYLLYTAPYMHNGVFETLEEVIDFYDQGGGEFPNVSPLLEPLDLDEDEKMDLLEFLESASGDEIRIQPPASPPYKPADN